jgi:hypothetical protein
MAVMKMCFMCLWSGVLRQVYLDEARELKHACPRGNGAYMLVG